MLVTKAGDVGESTNGASLRPVVAAIDRGMSRGQAAAQALDGG